MEQYPPEGVKEQTASSTVVCEIIVRCLALTDFRRKDITAKLSRHYCISPIVRDAVFSPVIVTVGGLEVDGGAGCYPCLQKHTFRRTVAPECERPHFAINAYASYFHVSIASQIGLSAQIVPLHLHEG
jgi:hypothetical protein